MTLQIQLEETIVQELTQSGVSTKLFEELRAAPKFTSVIDASKFLNLLDTKYYGPLIWNRIGIWLPRSIRDGNVEEIVDKTSYVVQSITNLPFKMTVVEGGQTTIDEVVDRLPLYVAIQERGPDKVAGYLVPNGQ